MNVRVACCSRVVELGHGYAISGGEDVLGEAIEVVRTWMQMRCWSYCAVPVSNVHDPNYGARYCGLIVYLRCAPRGVETVLDKWIAAMR